MTHYRNLIKYCKQMKIPYKSKGKLLKMYQLENNIRSRNNLNEARKEVTEQIQKRTKILLEYTRKPN